MAKKVADWKAPPEEGLAPWQKVLLGAIAAFIPFFLIAILPLLVRNHIVNTMNIPEETLLSVPEHINLVQTSLVPPTFKVTLQGVEFQIPNIYAPCRIERNRMTFRLNPRRIARTITIEAQPAEQPLDLQDSGLLKWFMPTSHERYLERALWATWHPVRVLSKAHLFASQGISGRVFFTEWDPRHRGFIFPTPGNTGYYGRVFRQDSPAHFSFAHFDEVSPVSLRDWTDLAMRVKPAFEGGEDAPAPPGAGGAVSLADAIRQASMGEMDQGEAMGRALTRFSETGSSSWLIPVLILLEKRGYQREIFDLYRAYAAPCRHNPAEFAYWKDHFDRVTGQMLSLAIDPDPNRNQVNLFARNPSQFQIRNLKLKIILAGREGERSFPARLLTNEPLHGGMEKTIVLVPPEGITVREAQGISWQIEDMELRE